MKLLYVNTLYYPFKQGGAEKSVQMLSENMAEKGHEVHVVSLSNKKKEPRTVNGVRVYYLKLKNVYWPFSVEKNPTFLKPLWHSLDIRNSFMFYEVERLFKSIKPDLIHTNNLLGFSTAIWKLRNKYQVPIVHTLRDYYLICPYTKMYRNGKVCEVPCTRCKAFNHFKKDISCDVDAVVGISKFILKKHLDNGFFNDSKNCVIGNPVDYPETVALKSYQREKIVFGYLGRLDESKGIEELLREFSDFTDQEYVSLIIAGKGEKEYVEKLKKKYSRNNITFVGYVDAEQFYRTIHYLIVPSVWNEPFGRIIIEANANGVPVIGTKRGAIPELININENGYIFNPDDSGSLANMLRKVVSEQAVDYLSLTQSSRRKSASFKSDYISNTYLDVYEKTITQ